jgi:hypothetical protein
MNARVEPPNRGRGCFGKGCLTFIVLIILLIVVGIGGSAWIFRNTYLSDKPGPVPETSVPSEASPAAAAQISPAQSTERTAAIREDLKKLKSAARSHEKTEVELTAGDINALISANRKSRGTAFVRIEDNVARVQLSIPLKNLDVPFQNAFGLGDRYLNGNVSISAPPGTNASTVQLGEVTINGHGLPTSLLDWGVPGVGKTLRSYVIKYANQYGVTDGEIRDGKVVLHTSGD